MLELDNRQTLQDYTQLISVCQWEPFISLFMESVKMDKSGVFIQKQVNFSNSMKSVKNDENWQF